MRNEWSAHRALPVLTVVWALAACSAPISRGAELPSANAGSSVTVSQADAISDHRTTAEELYVSTPRASGGAAIQAYKKTSKGFKLDCSMVEPYGYPIGLATDGRGTLYVANLSGYYYSTGVSIYYPQCKTGPTISDTYGIAHDVAIAGRTIYIENIYGAYSGNASIAVCSLSGCSSELTPPGGSPELAGIAVDKHGNVYADGLAATSSNGVILWEWRRGKMPGRVVGQNEPFFGGLELDGNGNLIADHFDLGGSTGLYILSGCPNACDTHGPYELIGQPYYFELNKKNSKLYVADESYSPSTGGSIDEYAYRGTAGIVYKKSIVFSTALGPASGIAIFPTPAP